MSIQICNFPFHPKFALQPRAQRSTRIFARTENDSPQSKTSDQQLNLSVLRFTFGIFFLPHFKAQIFPNYFRERFEIDLCLRL